MRSAIVRVSIAAVALALLPTPGAAHEALIGLAGKKVKIDTRKGPDKYKFSYQTDNQLLFPTDSLDPGGNGAALLVRGVGPAAGKTELIQFDPTLWKARGNPAGSKGYTYKDKDGTRGGVTKVSIKPGDIKIKAKGANWSWQPADSQVEVFMHFRIGQEGEDEFEWFCAKFGGEIMQNEADLFVAKDSPKLTTCPTEVCGNGEVEIGEECDDGNLDDDDGCNSDCTVGACAGQNYNTTLEAIQDVIFDSASYQCSTGFCHSAGAEQGGLDLTAGTAHGELVGVPSVNSGMGLDRVKPGDKDLSFLYEKLAAATLGTPLSGGSSMPSGGAPPLTEDHLEAIRLWIQAGAPEDGVVAGTAELLAGCLPDPTPQHIPVPDPPPALEGIQLWSNPWSLPMQSENEVCFATYYDLTGLVPASATFDCPNVCNNGLLSPCDTNADCDPANECVSGSVNNPSNKCFRYHKQSLYQDPLSHHAFVRIYLGQFDTTHAGWGPWTYKFQDQGNPLEGMACDPLDVDPSLGYNPGCSSETQEAVACLGHGPPDLSNGASQGLTGSGTTPTFTGSGVPVFEQEFADGVYSVLPMQGIIPWNSHAFNLTNVDTTMSIYLNLDFADPADQLYQIIPIFEDIAIFVQDVAPFTTHEYCRTWKAPQGARIFLLTSHTHQWGVQWRTWGPPNTPCSAPPNQSCGVPRPDTPLYVSTDYSDPLNLYFVPDPIELDDADDEDRTFLFCSLYDNGSTPESPSVKRQSTAAEPPLLFGLPVGPGGPCDDSELACLNGPMIGMPCNGDDSVCDSFEGAGDGVCDACPVEGGVTTTDEMFILQGAMYIVPVP